MSRTTILNKIATFILSGGRRTTASGTRDVLNEMANSYVSAIYDTAANFVSNNPVLETKQLGVETDDLATSPKFKIGDGVSDWNSLPYNGGSSSWGGIVGNINDQLDLIAILNSKGNFTYQATQMASSSAPVIDTTGYNKSYVEILGLATSANMTTNLTSSSNNYGDELILSFYDNGTSKAITWGALFSNKGAILPTKTVPNKRHYVRCVFDIDVPIWMCVEAKVEDSNNFQTKVVSSSVTALLGTKHVNVASSTYTDPSPVEGMGFEVYVLNGTATVGGVGYSVVGTNIYRYYHSGSWNTQLSENTSNKSSSYTSSSTTTYANTKALVDGLATKLLPKTFYISSINPLANTTYSFNEMWSTAVSGGSIDLRPHVYTRSFILAEATLSVIQSGNGSSQVVTVQLYNITTASVVGVIGTFTSDFGAATIGVFRFTGLNLAVNNTQRFSIRLVCPPWTTAPSGQLYTLTTYYI